MKPGTAIRQLKQIATIVINYRGRRKVAIRHQLFDHLSRFTPAVAAECGGVWYFLSTRDAGLSRVVFGEGAYEQDIMACAIELTEQAVSRRQVLSGRTFVDIGANIGTSSLPALLTFGANNVIAFEPDPENFRLLRCNAIANDVEERIQALPFALSDETGTGILERSHASWGDHRLRMRTDLPDGTFQESRRETLSVPTLTFDDAVETLGVNLAKVGMVWMDTQGHEGQILAGAQCLLHSDIPVVLEYWPYGLQRAGGLTLFHTLVAEHYSRVIDVRASMAASRTVALPAADVEKLESRYTGESYTDLVLIR